MLENKKIQYYTEGEQMKLSSYLNSKHIFINLEAKSIEEVINKVVERVSLVNPKISENKKNVIDTIIKREMEIPTAIGSGIAIPHARLENFDDFIIAIATLKEPFEAQVGGSNKTDMIKLVVVIMSDVLKNKNILKTMGAISKLSLQNPEMLEKIKEAKHGNTIIELIEESKIEILHKITAEDVLSLEVQPVKLGTNLEEVAKRFIAESAAGLPVVSDDLTFLGEITEKELIEYGMPKYTNLLNDLNFLTIGEPFEEYLLNEKTALIDEMYRKGVTIIDKEMPIMAICSLFVKKGLTRLYVVENNKYIGMVKRGDIIKKILHL